MKTILSQIQQFDSAYLSVSEIFLAEKEISHEIYACTAFGDVSLADSQILTNMLQGITKNKLSAFENALVQPKKKDDQSIAEIFVQKIAIPAKNTAVSPVETPFYNMRVTMRKIGSKKGAFKWIIGLEGLFLFLYLAITVLNIYIDRGVIKLKIDLHYIPTSMFAEEFSGTRFLTRGILLNHLKTITYSEKCEIA